MARLDAVVDWNLFLPLGDSVRTPAASKAAGGRPASARLVLLKMRLLQRLYQLADEATEYPLLDRLSFQRFVGLSLADKVPDPNTRRHFREALNARGLEQELFAAFVVQLAAKGFLPKNGCIVDARFVEVPRQRNTRAENTAIREGKMPEGWEKTAKTRAHKDVAARWTKKNEQVFYGYKDHIKVNAASQLIERAVVTPAATHDSQAMDQLVAEGDEVVFADSAYAGAPLGKCMEAKGGGAGRGGTGATQHAVDSPGGGDQPGDLAGARAGRTRVRRDERAGRADLPEVYRYGAQRRRDHLDEPVV